MAQARDWRGRFAGGGGGGGGGGPATRATGVAGPRGLARTSTKGRTRGELIGDRTTGRVYGSRVYSQRRPLGANREVRVQQIRGGRLSSDVPRNSRITRSAVGTRGRVGAPIAGNRNARYVSRTHAVARSASLPTGGLRGAGRLHSRGVVARASRTGAAPRSGYIVTYGRGSAPVVVNRGG